jgi:5-methylcytosine-specific restriction endonuclease McrA
MAEVTVYYEGSIVTRREAKGAGLKHYFTGKPCRYDHIDLRFVCDCRCRQCGLLKNRKESNRALRRRYKKSAQGKLAERRYRDRHSEELSVYFQDYRRTSRGKALVRARKTKFRRTAKGKASSRRECGLRRARQYGNGKGSFTAEDEAALREHQKCCHICGRRFTKTDPAELDHVIALAEGGAHDASNIALAHRSCNAQKGARRTHLI